MNKSYGAVFTLSLLLGFAALAGAKTEDVDIRGLAFQPATLFISIGDSVRWTNRDAMPHTATSDSGPGSFDSGILSQNQSYAFRFTIAGTYRYLCSIHTSMIGRIVVSPNGVEEGRAEAPGSGLALFPGRPNPFSDQTRIAFQLGKEGAVSLEVYNLLGKRVASLVQGTLKAGGHEVTWNGRTALGDKAAPGVYLYRLAAEGKVLTHRLALLR
jgi:plastocyanin